MSNQKKHPMPMQDAGYGDGEICSDGVITITSPFFSGAHRYRVGGIRAGYSARREWNGPMVSGPWAYLTELPLVLRADGGEQAANEKHIRVRHGDVLDVDGREYKVVFRPGGGGRMSRYDLEAVEE